MKRKFNASVNINRSASGAKLAKMSSKVHAYVTDWQGNVRAVANKQGSGTVTEQATWYYPYGMPTCDSRGADANRYKYTAKELITDHATNLYDYPARLYDPILGRWLTTDPYDEYFPNMSSYGYCNNNPIILYDPDGNSPTVVTGLIGGGIGAIVGGAIEVGIQLYKHGTITDWGAVGGAAAQGSVTGAAAGLTCGASLVVTVGVSSASNMVGGVVNREIQGKGTTATDVITDATIGGVAGSIGSAAGLFTKKGLDATSAATKGKIGEATTQLKYALKGYISNSKASIKTGKSTPTGRKQIAIYDFEMNNVFTKKSIIVESKFNTSGFTPNQKAALPRVKSPFVLDRTTSTQFQKGVQSTVSFGVQQVYDRLNND